MGAESAGSPPELTPTRNRAAAFAVCAVYISFGLIPLLVATAQAMRTWRAGPPVATTVSWPALLLFDATCLALAGLACWGILSNLRLTVTVESISKPSFLGLRSIRWDEVTAVEANGYSVLVRAARTQIRFSPRLVGGRALIQLIHERVAAARSGTAAA